MLLPKRKVDLKRLRENLLKYEQKAKPIILDDKVDEFIDKIYIEKINKKTNTRNIQIKWNFE